MTRFARAKGSKASNERAPEEGTPWAVMKEQLVRAKHDAEHARLREQAEKQRLENYEKFLKEQKTAKRKITWCNFPEGNEKPNGPSIICPPPLQQAQVSPSDILLPKRSKKNKKTDDSPNEEISHIEVKSKKNKKYDQALNEETSHIEKKNRKNIKSNHALNEKPSQIEVGDTIILTTDNVESNKPKKKKKNLQSKSIVTGDKEESQSNNDFTEIQATSQIKERLRKTQKLKNKKNKNQQSDSNNVEAQKSNDISIKKKIEIENTPGVPLVKANLAHTKQKTKKKKSENGKAMRRKADDDRSFQIIINGREVVLVRYDGFPVMQRDAERLEELRRSMAAKGIPKSELQRTMKLERRRAEKALARLKREVCYNCRKGGHNLSDCPDLRTQLAEPGAASGADGVCFKCGSTEHRQFECKVQRNQEFRFASCFICKEQGHIARQCPDNPKGLYPNGGGCKLCGDVTHLRKDCPTTRSEREETSVRLDTLAGTDHLEGISQPPTDPAAAAAAPARPGARDTKPKKVTF